MIPRYSTTGAFGALLVLAVFFSAPLRGNSLKLKRSVDSLPASMPDPEMEKKAASWVASLDLQDHAKETQVTALIANHLTAVRNWHNSHPYTLVPAGIDPKTGQPLTTLDRQVILDSSIPDSVHKNLMRGLEQQLNKSQVAAVLDKYTVGKVAFTMTGYKAIVPDLTNQEDSTLQGYLVLAREQAIDYKNMKEISAIFEIYKTKCEGYLNGNGRNWHALYSAYVKKIKAEKAAHAVR